MVGAKITNMSSQKSTIHIKDKGNGLSKHPDTVLAQFKEPNSEEKAQM